MPVFKNGTHVNQPKHCTGYLRISAGKWRGSYVHTKVAEAKMGRELKKDSRCKTRSKQHVPDCECETVEHRNGDGLDCDFGNLRVVRVWENTMLMQQRLSAEKENHHNEISDCNAANGNR